MAIRILDIHTIQEARAAIKKIGADTASVKIMAPKALHRSLILETIDNRAANIIKQEMLALGAEAVVSWKVSTFCRGVSDVLILATDKQLKIFIDRASKQPFGLKKIAEEIENSVRCYNKDSFVVECGSWKLHIKNRPLVMGVLNITPDSFSDGGEYFSVDAALARAHQMVNEGADIIDIGGESSRPGARPVSQKEEIARVLPVIKRLQKHLRVPLSIDTYKPGVASAAIDAGVSIINDITGLRYEHGKMAQVAQRKHAAVIIMHMQGMPRTMQHGPAYGDVVSEIHQFFSERIEVALDAGLRHNHLILDPGIGFGKKLHHNLQILKRLKEFSALGMPLMIGVSLKSFLGKILGQKDAKDRAAGSLAAVLWSVWNGSHIVRVHNVKETMEGLKIMRAIQTGYSRE